MLTQDEIQQGLAAHGYDPSKFTASELQDGSIQVHPLIDAQPTAHMGMQQPGYGGTQPSTALGAAARGAATSVLPAMAGGAGAGLASWGLGAAGAPETGGLSLLLPILTAIGSSYGAAKLQNKVMPSVLGEQTTANLQQQMAQDQQQHPYAQMLGAAAANIAGGLSPSLSNVGQAGGDLAKLVGRGSGLFPDLEQLSGQRLGNLANVGIGAGLQGGLTTAQQLSSGQPLNPTDILAQTALGALFNSPNAIGQKLYGFHPTGNLDDIREQDDVGGTGGQQTKEMLALQKLRKQTQEGMMEDLAGELEKKEQPKGGVKPPADAVPTEPYERDIPKDILPRIINLFNSVGAARNIKFDSTIDRLVNEEGLPLNGRTALQRGTQEAVAQLNPHNIDTFMHEGGHAFTDSLLNPEPVQDEGQRIVYKDGQLQTNAGDVVNPSDYTRNQATVKRFLDNTQELMESDPDAKAAIARMTAKGDKAISDPEEFLQQVTGEHFEGQNKMAGMYKPSLLQDLISAYKNRWGNPDIEDVTRLYQNKFFRDPQYRPSVEPKVNAPVTSPAGGAVKEQPEQRDKIGTMASGIDTVEKYQSFERGLKKQFGPDSEEYGKYLSQTPLWQKADDNLKGVLDPEGMIATHEDLAANPGQQATTHIPVAPERPKPISVSEELPSSKVPRQPVQMKPGVERESKYFPKEGTTPNSEMTPYQEAGRKIRQEDVQRKLRENEQEQERQSFIQAETARAKANRTPGYREDDVTTWPKEQPEDREKLYKAAVRTPHNQQVYEGDYHADAWSKAMDDPEYRRYFNEHLDTHGEEPPLDVGFTTSKGRYVSRMDANKEFAPGTHKVTSEELLHGQDFEAEARQAESRYKAQPEDRDKLSPTFAPTRSAIDTERAKVSPELADAHTKLLNYRQELLGKLRNPVMSDLHELSPDQQSRVRQVLEKERDTQEDWSGMLQTQPERQAYRTIRDKLAEQYDERVANNQPVITSNGKYRKAKQDPFFFPSQLSRKVADTLRSGKDTAAIEQYHQDWMDKAEQDEVKPDKAEEQWRELNSVLRGDLGNPSTAGRNEAFFNGIRKQEGKTLPESMREQNLPKLLDSYFRRSAADMAWYKHIESDPKVAAMHGYTKTGWGEALPEDVTEANPSMMGNQATKDIVHAYRGEAGQGFSTMDKTSHAAESLATIGILGPLTEAHKMVSSVAQAIGFAKPSEATDVMRGLMDYHKGWLKALKTGEATVPTRTFQDNLRLMVNSQSTVAERLGGLAQSLRSIYTVSGFSDKFIPGFLHNAGEAIMSSRVAKANAGDIDAQQFLKHYDPDYQQGKTYAPEEMEQMAGRFANTIHGSRDARTLPAYMLKDNEISAFLKLAHWQIGSTNAWMRNVYGPATKGNLSPLLMSSLGSVLGGYTIKKLREEISNRKTPVPTWDELEASDRNARQGLLGKTLGNNKEMVAYNLMELASIAGFGGILSSTLKAGMDVAARNAPSGLGTIFPLDEVATSTARIGDNIVSAILSGQGDSNWFHVMQRGVTDWLSQNVQLARIGMSTLERAGMMPSEYEHKMDYTRKLQDLRRFKEAAGLPYEDQVSAQDENPYMNLEAGQFKREPDLAVAMQELPPLIHQLVGKYQDRPTVLMSKLEALKKTNYETMPSMENDPLGLASYNNANEMTLGQKEASDRLLDYLRQHAVDEAKASVIP